MASTTLLLFFAHAGRRRAAAAADRGDRVPQSLEPLASRAAWRNDASCSAMPSAGTLQRRRGRWGARGYASWARCNAETLLRWYCELVARKWTLVLRRRPGRPRTREELAGCGSHGERKPELGLHGRVPFRFQKVCFVRAPIVLPLLDGLSSHQVLQPAPCATCSLAACFSVFFTQFA